MSSEFQAYKHVDIIGPGEYARANTPLEATLSFHPTVVLTNALPPLHGRHHLAGQHRESGRELGLRRASELRSGLIQGKSFD